MNEELNKLSQKYLASLRKHLGKGGGETLQAATGIGRRAVTLGLETLALARIHEGALAALSLLPTTEAIKKRAQVFFTEVITPVVQTHSAARQSKEDLNRLRKTLGRRTGELSRTTIELKRGIARRKTVEAALKESSAHYSRLLNDSLQLQAQLRQITYRVLEAQEEERKQVSRELQNEIAQTLLGINVRLLALKREAATNTHGFKKEIAGTRRLVTQSAHSVRQVARRFGKS